MGSEFPFYAVQMSSSPPVPPVPPVPSGYGVVVLQKSGPISLKVLTLKNAHIRELDIVTPNNKQICSVTNSVVGQKFQPGLIQCWPTISFQNCH